MVKCLPEFEYITVFLKNKNIIFKIRRPKVTDYAALSKPSNIHNIIDLFTDAVLHIVAKQPIKIAKKPLELIWWFPWLQRMNF